MAVLNFPANPTDGQVYDYPPFKYKWDGEKWRTVGTGANPVFDAIAAHKIEPGAHGIENITNLNDELGNRVRRLGLNLAGDQNGINFTSNGTWVAANFHTVGGMNRAVIGTLSNGATIGGHTEDMNAWSALYVNTYPGITVNQENAPVILNNPKRQVALSVGGTPTGVHFPLVSRGIHSISPSWWINQRVCRMIDGNQFMAAATNGARSDIDWSYIQRFRFTIKVYVNAPSANVYRHTYLTHIAGYTNTNGSDPYILPHTFMSHAQGGANQATLYVQQVPGTENNGMPYVEIHFPGHMGDIANAPDREISVTIVAENIFE